MKKVFLITLLLMFCFLLGAEAVNKSAQKFEVEYTIIYNAITLEEAADKEILIKKRFKDACEVNIEVKKQNNQGSVGVPIIVTDIDTDIDTDNNLCNADD